MATEALLSEIQIFAFDFAPRNWALCNGATMAISQNQALFSLLGTTYGGNGSTTFNLPDLRSRTAISAGVLQGGSTYNLGQSAGEENHTLTIQEMPSHNHLMMVSSNNADQPQPNGMLLAQNPAFALYSTTQDGTLPANNMLAGTGGTQGHPNIQPYLCLNYCICIVGIFPSRN